MITETQQGYSTGYGSPENVLKELYTAYNRKENTVGTLIFIFVLITGLAILNTESWNFALIAFKMVILGVFILSTYLINSYWGKKEALPALVPENYAAIIQTMKNEYKFHWRILLLPIFALLYIFILYWIDDSLKAQPFNWSLIVDKFLGILIIFVGSTIYGIYFQNKRRNKLKNIEAQLS